MKNNNEIIWNNDNNENEMIMKMKWIMNNNMK